jgi:hypothetical protein
MNHDNKSNKIQNSYDMNIKTNGFKSERSFLNKNVENKGKNNLTVMIGCKK